MGTPDNSRMQLLIKLLGSGTLVDGTAYPALYPFERMHLREIITQSMWRAFGTCQEAFRLKYVVGLDTISTAMPLLLGKLADEIFADLGMGVLRPDQFEDRVTAWATEQEQKWHAAVRKRIPVRWDLQKLYDSTNTLISMVDLWLKKPLTEATPIATHVKFRVPLPHPTTGRRDPIYDYGGEWDGLLVGHHETLWLWERKTTAEGDPDEYERKLEHDPQRWGYCWALSVITGRPVGILYDVTRKKPPTVPGFLVCKKGPCGKTRKAAGGKKVGDPHCGVCGGSGIIGISKTVTDTTLDLFDAALMQLRLLSPAGKEAIESGQYNEQREKIRRNEHRFTFRIWRTMGREYMEAVPKELYAVAREIGRKKRGTTPFLHHRGNCRQIGRSCEFLPICPTIGSGEALRNFKKRDATVPVELSDAPDTEHWMTDDDDNNNFGDMPF